MSSVLLSYHCYEKCEYLIDNWWKVANILKLSTTLTKPETSLSEQKTTYIVQTSRLLFS